MRTHVSAFAPASVSNVACGFDIMGFALGDAGDTIAVRPTRKKGIHIVSIDGCQGPIPTDPAKNTAGPPVHEVMRRYGYDGGIEVEIHKGLPIGSGIGSSAASAVAAAVAADALLGGILSKHDLLECSVEGEKIASGALHVDNLAPCLWGGFVLVRGYDPIDIVPIASPLSLWCAVIVPEVEIRTSESRKLLPKHIPLADVVAQTGNAAGLIAGLMSGDAGLIRRSLKDRIAEPVRKGLIPGYENVKAAALEAGALGCNISGSGPAIFALCESKESAGGVAAAMSASLKQERVTFSVFTSNIHNSGARVLEAE